MNFICSSLSTALRLLFCFPRAYQLAASVSVDRFSSKLGIREFTGRSGNTRIGVNSREFVYAIAGQSGCVIRARCNTRMQSADKQNETRGPRSTSGDGRIAMGWHEFEISMKGPELVLTRMSVKGSPERRMRPIGNRVTANQRATITTFLWEFWKIMNIKWIKIIVRNILWQL